MTVQRFPCHFILNMVAGALLLPAAMSGAQALGPQHPAPVRQANTAKPTIALPVAPAQDAATPAPGHSLLEQPAVPSKVTLEAGRLSVTAANASLSQTLRDIASATGMQIDGISKDQRVFGVYGPGSAQEVLTALLDDSGYNVMMVGGLKDGAPRQLVLSARATGVSTASPQSARSQAAEDDDDDVPAPPAELQPTAQAPAAAPAQAAPAQAAQPAQVKTPQQMLEELQQLHKGQDPPAVPRDQPPQ